MEFIGKEAVIEYSAVGNVQYNSHGRSYRQHAVTAIKAHVWEPPEFWPDLLGLSWRCPHCYKQTSLREVMLGSPIDQLKRMPESDLAWLFENHEFTGLCPREKCSRPQWNPTFIRALGSVFKLIHAQNGAGVTPQTVALMLADAELLPRIPKRRQ